MVTTPTTSPGSSVTPIFGEGVPVDVAIAVSASLSTAADLKWGRLLGLIIPADTEGSAVTFQGSIDGVNWYNVYDANGAEYSVAFTDPCYLAINPLVFLGLRYVKVRTGTSGSATTQSGAAATITLVAA